MRESSFYNQEISLETYRNYFISISQPFYAVSVKINRSLLFFKFIFFLTKGVFFCNSSYHQLHSFSVLKTKIKTQFKVRYLIFIFFQRKKEFILLLVFLPDKNCSLIFINPFCLRSTSSNCIIQEFKSEVEHAYAFYYISTYIL